jgi:alpha-tubulin suppressor-like RCC1 family protein
MATGGVRCWGSNGEGQLGDGTTTDRLTPPPSDVLDSVQAIAAGAAHTCALMQNSGVRCWGRNIENENDVTSLLTPPDHDLLTSVQAITAGADHTCALMVGGGLRCWGSNYEGQLGLATPDNSRPAPVEGICE